MACLASRFPFFSRPGFEPFRAICVPFIWTQATSHSAGLCWCLWDLSTRERAPLSLNLRCACGIHIFDLMSFYPQLQWINYHCMHAHVHVYHTLMVLCYALCAQPFSLKSTEGNGPSFCTGELQTQPRLNAVVLILSVQPELLWKVFSWTSAFFLLPSLLTGSVTQPWAHGRPVSAPAIN